VFFFSSEFSLVNLITRDLFDSQTKRLNDGRINVPIAIRNARFARHVRLKVARREKFDVLGKELKVILHALTLPIRITGITSRAVQVSARISIDRSVALIQFSKRRLRSSIWKTCHNGMLFFLMKKCVLTKNFLRRN